MIIDIYFEGDNGAENIGTITLDNGVLGGTSDFARKLISRPLALGPVQAKGIPSPPVEVEERDGGMYWIDPAKYPDAFMAALPRAISSSRQVAQVRAAVLEVPSELP